MESYIIRRITAGGLELGEIALFLRRAQVSFSGENAKFSFGNEIS